MYGLSHPITQMHTRTSCSTLAAQPFSKFFFLLSF
jgi:hypothetical protein